ncbi:lasso peptide biosynthesis B2 protein [Neobacillus citreus]|nr:lasso peptide biosynthesis B2 protein [Neobacillus citreus]MCH6266017.1 lasso peptide biosynthesis B2 protein [Neobacillus citreus]
MRKILIEAYFYLAWGRILKWIPFSKVAPSLGFPMEDTSFDMDSSKLQTLKQISKAIYLMSGYTFWESECLVKAFAAMKMLEKRHLDCTLYLGIAKDETGKLIAHAWLRNGSYYITGKEGMESYTVVQKFAKIVKGSKQNYDRVTQS